MSDPTQGALLEREREIKALRRGLAEAGAGNGTLMLVQGPAGAGKTELARLAAVAADEAGFTSLAARASELERTFAFGVVRQLLETQLKDMDSDAFVGAAEPASRLFEPGGGPLRIDEAGFEALHSLYWLVVNLASRGPLLVSIDDCQWADMESLRFLSYLAQRIEGLPVALLLAGRRVGSVADESGVVWAQIASLTSAIVLSPRPLSPVAATELTRERLGAGAAEEFCRACHTATGGNPLFLHELLSALDTAGTTPSAAAASEIETVGPGAVSRFVQHRLAAVGTSAGELARAVAVIGDDSDLRLASRVAGLDDDAARSAADELVRVDILRRDARLGFVHPIVRAAVYDALGPGEREARHAAVAEFLADDGASAERRAAHLLMTRPNGHAATVATLRQAAASAVRRGAPQAAAAALRRALAESPPDQERAEILVELAGYEIALMEFDRAGDHLRAVLQSEATLAIRADAAATMALCATVSGGEGAEAAATALLRLGEELGPSDPERSLELACELLMLATVTPGLRGQLGEHLKRVGDQARGRAQFEAVVSIYRAHDRLVRGGSAAEAVAQIEAALAGGLPPSVARGGLLLALVTFRLAERYDLALRLLDIGLERARAEGRATLQGMLQSHRAAISLAQGSVRDAQVDAETGLMLVDPRHFVMPQLLAVMIATQIERGDLAAADELVRRGDELGVADDRALLDEFLAARGLLRIAQGSLEKGVTDLRWLGERLESFGLRHKIPWRAYAAPALAAMGETAAARSLAADQLDIAQSAGSPGGIGLALRAAALVADEGERVGMLGQAIEMLEESSSRLELAHALCDLGTELSRAGRRREGRDRQRRALEIAETCGAIALADRARTELLGGPGRRARIELTGPGALTASEWRVCREVTEGLTNREVAEALFVTEKTVERHLRSAYRKLGIRSRHQLAESLGGA